MPIDLRPGQPVDLPDIAAVDIAANYNHPAIEIPFAKASDCHAVILDRYTYFFNHPEYHFLVATSEDEVVGFLVWRKPGDEGIAKWEPKLPEGTNLKFFRTLLPASEMDKARYDNDGLYELEALAVSPTQQRRGIGNLLLKEFLKSVDSDHAGSYITSSVVGKPVYERLGWKVRGEFRIDLSGFGRKEEYVSYNMKRDGVV